MKNVSVMINNGFKYPATPDVLIQDRTLYQMMDRAFLLEVASPANRMGAFIWNEIVGDSMVIRFSSGLRAKCKR